MEDLEKFQETMKSDMDALKEQIAQLMEAFKATKNIEGNTSTGNQDETPLATLAYGPVTGQIDKINAQGNLVSATAYPFHHMLPPPQPHSQPHSQPFPPYGLPYNYTPFTANNPSNEGVTVTTSSTSNTVPPSTIAHDTSQIPAPFLTGNPQNTARPQALQFVVGEGPPIIHAVPTAPPEVMAETLKAKEKFESLEERLKAVEVGGNYGFGDAIGLCLVPDVIIPPKFKAPEFEKYSGTTCPKSHLTMYCRKMAAYAHDERLLVHIFQDSLTGAAFNWYMHLEPARIRSWKDLADAFLR